MLREGAYTKPYFNAFIQYLGNKLRYITTQKSLVLYIIWYILPRTVLIIVLMVDTFYFHKLKNIYSIAFLTLVIFICYYIIYSIKITVKQYTEYLDYYYIVEITSKDYEDSHYFIDIEDIRWDQISINYFKDIKYYEWSEYIDDSYEKTENYLKIQRFIDIQTTALWLNYTPYAYKCLPNWNIVEKYYSYTYRQSNRMWDLRKIPKKDLVILEKEFNILLPITIQLQLFLETYESISKKHPFIKYMLIIITSLYFFTWLYILFVSFYSYLPHIDTISLILDIQDTYEPFSGLELDNTNDG
jgi:hypothetical protein